MRTAIGRLFILLSISLFMLGGILVVRRYSPALAFKTDMTEGVQIQATVIPQQIVIPLLKLDLPIVGARISKGVWDTTTVGVSYLARSPVPGEYGNSILYGHNWPTLLGSLGKLKPGDKILVRYQNAPDRSFTVQFINTVNPDQTYILHPTKDRRITLYTCTGWLDSKRLVVTAILDPEQITMMGMH